MAKEIPLTRGLVAIVDDEDYAWLNQFKWHVRSGNKRKPYASRRGVGPDGETQNVTMHRVIMAAPPSVLVDHINGDTLDNRRVNLRFCNAQENTRNRGRTRRISSTEVMYKGVVKSKNTYRASIMVDGCRLELGNFRTPEAAAVAYDEAARAHFGGVARLNGVDQILAEPRLPEAGPRKREIGSSGYRGVVAHRDGFRAQISVDGKQVRIGYFATAEDAACAYDQVAQREHGRLAILNFPDTQPSTPTYARPSRKRPALKAVSGFRGVCKRHHRYRASITIRGKNTFIGTFATAEEAARAYDERARKEHGPLAKLNFPRPGETPARPA